MRRVRKQKNIIIMVVMLALFIMASGYAIYQKRLDIGGVANIDYKDWNIRILSIDTVDSSNGVDVVKPSHTNTTAKFNSKITKVGGFIKYKIVVKNSGTIDGVLGAINIEDVSNSVITYNVEGVDIDDELKSGEEATIYVTATYDSSKVDTATTNKSSITLNLNYVQLEGYVSPYKGTLPTRTTSDTYWLTNKLENASIESIQFLNSNEVPNDVGENYFDASLEQNGSIMGYFYDADSDGLKEVYVGQMGGVNANVNSSNLFYGLSELTSINLENLDVSEVNLMADMFNGTKKLTSLDLTNFVSSSVTTTKGMFYDMNALTNLVMTGWDTSSVTDMGWMFSGCKSLTVLNVSNFNTSNVWRMSDMFYAVENVETLDLSNFNTSNVENMGYMFNAMYKLKNLNISSFDTSKVEDMAMMFRNTYVLENLDVSHFDTSNVDDMEQMFAYMYAIKTLDLSSFDTSKVESTRKMFIDDSLLTTIYVSDLWVNTVNTNSEYMFEDIYVIVGSSGTTYDENKVDVNMANYQYGYFTYKETENSKVVPGSDSLNGYGGVSGKLTMLDNNGNGEITFYWYDPSSANTTDTITMPFIFLLDDGGSDCARYDDDLIITYDSKGLGSATITVTDLYEDTYNYTEFVAVNNIFELP